MKWWHFADDQPARPSAARLAMHGSLARQACGDAFAGMRALLAAHEDVVAGEVEPVIGLKDLRRVASSDSGASRVVALAPLAVGLRDAAGYREARGRIEELAARLAQLEKLTETIR